MNWGATAAVLVAVGYGGWAMGLPSLHTAHAPWSVPVGWLLAGGVYAAVGAAQAGYSGIRSALRRARGAVRQAIASRAEARRQAAANKVEAKRLAAASKVEAKRQAAARRAEAKRQAARSRAEARRKARAKRVAARRAAAKRRPARPSRLQPKPVPAPRPRPRDYLEAIRRDVADLASVNPYLDLIADGAVPRERLGVFAAEQAQLRASDRRSFLYLAARSNDLAGSMFAEFADAERRALDLLAIFSKALGRQPEAPASPPRAGCRAYPAFVAWLALNAEPADAAVALVACRPTWSASLAGIGRALRERPGYRFDDRACAFFDLMAAPDSHTDDQLIGLLQQKLDAGQQPVRATGYAQLLASYQAMFWSALAEASAEAVATGQ